jgi:hypothetical protein
MHPYNDRHESVGPEGRKKHHDYRLAKNDRKVESGKINVEKEIFGFCCFGL